MHCLLPVVVTIACCIVVIRISLLLIVVDLLLDMSKLSAYLQIYRLKLSHIKTVTAAFYLNNRDAKRELNLYSNDTFIVLYNPYLSWGKTGQIAHISSPSSGIAQKTILAGHTAEATRGLGMGCWC